MEDKTAGSSILTTDFFSEDIGLLKVPLPLAQEWRKGSPGSYVGALVQENGVLSLLADNRKFNVTENCSDNNIYALLTNQFETTRAIKQLTKTIVVTPTIDGNYRNRLQQKLQQSLHPGNVTNVDVDTNNYLFRYYTPQLGDGSDDDMAYSKDMLRGTKLTAEQAKEGVFALFEGRETEGIRLKTFQDKLRYPIAGIKSILQEVAELKSM